MNGQPTAADHGSLSSIILHFNRRSLGRLRQLIDAINAEAA
jgi:hypothetical protein